MLSWIDFLACRGLGHDCPDLDPGLGFHWFLTLLESAVHIGYNCDHVLECIKGIVVLNCSFGDHYVAE